MMISKSIIIIYSRRFFIDFSSFIWKVWMSIPSSCSRINCKSLSIQIPISSITANGRTIVFEIRPNHPMNCPPTSKLKMIKKLSTCSILNTLNAIFRTSKICHWSKSFFLDMRTLMFTIVIPFGSLWSTVAIILWKKIYWYRNI